MTNAIFSSKYFRALFPAFAGFIGYGGWGFFCNFMYGFSIGLKSGLTQGGLSFSITLASNFVMEFFYKRTERKWPTVCITSSLFIAIAYVVNTLSGTPEVLWTIAPGAIFGTIYITSYVSALQRVA